jgi:sigma-B regulation protein RsbU (phosphoserine phosphatase)
MESLFNYRKLIDSFKAGNLSDVEVEKHLSDLMLLFDFSASLNQAPGLAEIRDLLLLTLMGYTASRQAVFLLQTQKGLELQSAKGYRTGPLRKDWPLFLTPPYRDYYSGEDRISGGWSELLEFYGVNVLLPIQQDHRLLAVVGLGQKSSGRSYSPHQMQMMVALSQMSAGALENAESRQTLQSLNRQLTLKIYQLNTLFELSKDFNTVWDCEAIFRILGSSLIGQLLISRCAVVAFVDSLPHFRFMRGFRFGADDLTFIENVNAATLFGDERRPLFTGVLPEGEIKIFCTAKKIHLIFPMTLNDEIRGLIFLGDKKNRKPFGQEDFDFITTLGNLALVADENVRMQQAMIEKQRMEKELAIARDIQVSLLPQASPQLAGYEIASVFHPCYSVAGDYFDFLPVSDCELAVAIGDVSGKGTPAALIMACLQASLRTLTALHLTDPVLTIQKINQLLCESQSSKYVTFFYGILNFQTHQLSYVNAGHCYPLIAKQNGNIDRLESGGTVLGFFKDAGYKSSTYTLDPGDSMLLYTDGVSEMMNRDEEEFGVERIIQILLRHRSDPVLKIRDSLVNALQTYREDQPQGDDTTFILLKRL